MQKRITRVSVLGLVAATFMFAAPAQADTTKDFTTGAALIGANILYVPAKLVYAFSGGIVAAAAYGISGGDADVVDPILAAAVRGDYVIDEAHLKGRKRVEFVGRLAEHERTRDVAAGPVPRPIGRGQGEDAGF